MKRSALALALIGLLGIGGAVTWRLLRRGPAPSQEVRFVPASAAADSPASSAGEANSIAQNATLDPQPPGEEIVGIGAILKVQPETGALMIAGAVPNSPAAAAGLAGEFLIRKIDDVPTDGMKLRECVDRIRGVAGSKVRLELSHVDASEPMVVELTRQRIQVEAPPAPRGIAPDKSAPGRF